MNRFPPTLGVVGFDFGLKPAFSVAVVPGHGVRQQDDGDGVPDYRRCHDVLGDNLDVVVAGVTVCGGCYTINAGGGPQDVHFSFTGVNGSFTAVWDAFSSTWQVVIGTATVTFYGSTDGSCAGETGDSTADVVLSLTCQGDNTFTATGLAGAAISIVVFSNVGAGAALGDPIPNLLILGDCGTGSTVFVGGYGGSVTATLPP